MLPFEINEINQERALMKFLNVARDGSNNRTSSLIFLRKIECYTQFNLNIQGVPLEIYELTSLPTIYKFIFHYINVLVRVTYLLLTNHKYPEVLQKYVLSKYVTFISVHAYRNNVFNIEEMESLQLVVSYFNKL